jgi:tetratricopeptide (TPR) repeat protein
MMRLTKAESPLPRITFVVLVIVGSFRIATEPCAAQELSPAPSPDQAGWLEPLTAKEQSLERQGKYADAIPLAKQLLELTKQAFGQDDPAVAHVCLVLARLYYEVANYTGAEPLFQETLRIYRKIGAESEEVAKTLSLMEQTAIKLFQQEQELEREEKYVEAIPLAQQVLELSKQRSGPENVTVAYALEILAALYNRLDKYEQAERLYLEALGIKKKAGGPESNDVAATLKRLGRLYYDMGEYANAEPLFQEELGLENKQFGPESKEVAETLGNLGGVYSQMGDYARSEPLLQEELKIEKKTLGLESKEVATTLNNLGVLYSLMGDHATAEPLYLEALRIQKKVLGPENEDVARTLNNLAQVYAGMRDYEKAAYCYGQALQVEKKVLGPEDLYVAITLNNLALLWDDAGNYAEAERLYQDSLRIHEKIQGPGHPGVATTLDNLALLYHHMGKYAKAEPLYREALGIYSKWFGDEHPDTIICRRKLALLDIDLGRSDDARALALTAWNHQAHLVERILSFASEQQRLAYQNSNSVFSLSVLAATKGNEVPLALAILRDKGVVLDSLMEDQAFYRANRKTASGEDLLDKLATDKQRIGRLLLQPIQNSTQSKDELQRLQDEVQTIESKLAKDVASTGRTRRALSVTAEQIISALPEDTALIEYFTRGNYLGQAQWEGAFGAVVFLRGQKEIFVTLPSSKVLSPTIKRYVHLLSQSDLPDGDEVTRKLAQLYQQVWEPIQKVLPSTIKRVIISPDGQLNFISFATLLDLDQQFRGEKLVVE